MAALLTHLLRLSSVAQQHQRTRSASDVLSVGESLDVKIIDVDEFSGRVRDARLLADV
jgi:ribosomal protein S1